jgi:DNA-binding transcriptional ArsR family regulator
MKERASGIQDVSGDELLALLSALASPHRLRVIAALSAGGRQYVSQLAREIGMSRPLLHMHLQRLEAAGLVTSSLELSSDGKAMKYFEVTPFALQLTPEAIARAATTLHSEQSEPAETAPKSAEEES